MSSTCWQITFHPVSAPDSAFEDFLAAFFEVTAQNYSSSGFDEYIGYISPSFDEQQMLITAATFGVTLPPYDVSELKSENWLKDYVIKFAPFEVGQFCIYGIHEQTPPKTDKIALQIYAATAFGSDHQTTRGCIEALCELKQQGFTPKKVLDIGTGSGILSLCTAKLWDKASILASDIDDEATIVTNSNAATNSLSSHIKAITADGYQSEVIKSFCPCDLVLSNILANPLIAFAPNLASALNDGGYCVLSGFIDNQVDDVISAHTAQGLELVKLYSHDNWRAALMQKKDK